MYDDLFAELLSLLEPLEAVGQSPVHHPEGNALFHSLQVFEEARRSSREPAHWAAALLHDVGKAVVAPCHAAAGADLLEGFANQRVQWLVAHHLDLLREPKLTRTTLRLDPRLRDLERLRAWDLAGRKVHALVPSVERALGLLLEPGVAETWIAPSAIVEDDWLVDA
jgi:hypothetical protein